MAKEEIKAYESMSELMSALGEPSAQQVDFTIHRLEQVHGKVPFRSPVFRANYYSVILVREGRGRYVLDEHASEIRDRTFYFTNPGHLKGFEIDEPTSGYVITFAEPFLKQYVGPDVLEDLSFLISEVVPPQYLDPGAFGAFDALAGSILREMAGSSALKLRIVGSLVNVLLLRIKDGPWGNYDPLEAASGPSRIASTFRRNLEAYFRDLAEGRRSGQPQVQDLARLQHLHPNYLSTVIKQRTGKTALAWIADKTTAEASALLARSSLSMKEIAHRLGFAEPAHFSRFFKERTGRTPSVYRQSARAAG